MNTGKNIQKLDIPSPYLLYSVPYTISNGEVKDFHKASPRLSFFMLINSLISGNLRTRRVYSEFIEEWVYEVSGVV